MEFFDLSRYRTITTPVIPLFSELRTMKPVQMSQNLELSEEPENLRYVEELVNKSITVVPIRRKPPTGKQSNGETFPKRILFEMTSKCNFLCRMCPQQNLKRPRMDMSGELYRKVIDEIDTYGIEGIWLYHLGESLLHPEFRENINEVKVLIILGRRQTRKLTA